MKKNQRQLELYAVFVGTITATEQRRQQASAVYLSLISAGAATLGIVNNLDPIYIIIPAIFVSAIWLASILYFRGLSKAKFEVIKKLEAEWDLKPFELEWYSFQKQKKKNVILRIELTHLEMFPPITIGLSGTIYLLYRIINVFC